MKLLRKLQTRFLTTWPVAAAALGGLLLLIGTSGLSTSHKAEDIYRQLDQLNSHHREVDSKLRRLRGDVHLSGIFIRDYLLDTDRESGPEYRRQLTVLRENHSAMIRQLRALTPKEASARVENLEERLNDYWQVFEPLFDWTAAEKIARSASFLRREVVPRREAVLTIAREIEELNNANLAAQRAEVTRRQQGFRSDLERSLLRSLLLGLLVAAVAVMRLRALERRSNEQRLRAESAEQEMRQLSQQLVATQEEERKKLTRELHDHVGQMLTALRMEIGRADRERAVSQTRAGQALAECKRLVDTVLRSVRDLVMGLRPSMLDDFGLQPALEWHVRDFRRRYNIRVDLELRGDLNALPDQHRTCVYRIVQEALTNCARHSQATRVDVSARCENGSIEVVVADDGVGVDPEKPRGMGLIGIEERARELGGGLEVTAGDNGGTRLYVTLPVVLPQQESELASAAG